MTAATTVDRSAIEAWLAHYGLGDLRDLSPTDNPSAPYLLTTTAGHYRLLLPAQTEPVAFCLALANVLADAGLPCARPVMTREGQATQPLAGRVAALLPDTTTRAPAALTSGQCTALGDVLARLHVAAQSFALRRDNPQALARWRAMAGAMAPQLDAETNALLAAELHYQALYRFSDLPSGTIHGHPLPEQLRFSDSAVADLGDLTHACSDRLLVDVALAVAGCARKQPGIDTERARALLDAYHARRPLTAIERGAWPTLLRAAALQLWLGVLNDVGPAQAAPYRQLLEWLTTNEKEARALWPRASVGGKRG